MRQEPFTAGRIRLLVVDDHDLFRVGLASLLASEPDLEVVGQASSGRMAVRLATELQPDVVLMDVRMPDLDGAEATRAIVASHPTVRVMALTVVSSEQEVASILEAGACGFLGKDTPVDGIAVAVRGAAQGATWLSPQAAEVVLTRVRSNGARPQGEASRIEQLSPRELEVLRLLARGLDNAALATELGISPRTAKNHVSSILAKLGLLSRLQAAVYAVRQGLT